MLPTPSLPQSSRPASERTSLRTIRRNGGLLPITGHHRPYRCWRQIGGSHLWLWSGISPILPDANCVAGAVQSELPVDLVEQRKTA